MSGSKTYRTTKSPNNELKAMLCYMVPVCLAFGSYPFDHIIGADGTSKVRFSKVYVGQVKCTACTHGEKGMRQVAQHKCVEQFVQAAENNMTGVEKFAYCRPALLTFGGAERSDQGEDGAGSSAVVPVGHFVLLEANRLSRRQIGYTRGIEQNMACCQLGVWKHCWVQVDEKAARSRWLKPLRTCIAHSMCGPGVFIAAGLVDPHGILGVPVATHEQSRRADALLRLNCSE